mmetsp:Transcript_43298/g.101880  ORF Transcript_43298/g.101880 Transcript_43298/m.101880 type:complete len:226 (+) Transcript_43298:74-751(+)
MGQRPPAGVAAEPCADLAPAKVGAGVAEEAGKEDTSEDALTNEERWSMVWAVVNIYYTWDASFGLVVASLAFAVGLVFKLVLAADCESDAWIVSLVVLGTRALDAFCGCAGILRDPFPSRKAFLCDILRNMFICILQGVLALVILAMSVAAWTDDESCWLHSLISIGCSLLLMAQATEEFPIWCIVLFLWCIAGSAAVPNWVDNAIPKFLRERAKARRMAKQNPR